MKSSLRWSGFGIAALLLAGCGTLDRARGVSVNLVNIAPTQASLLETSAALTVRVINETPRPMTFVGSTHRLYVNGSYIGRAVTNQSLTLPQFGSATQTVTAYLENLALMRKLGELQQATRIDYRLESEFHPEGEGRFGRLRATSSGQLDFSGWRALLGNENPRGSRSSARG